MKRGRIKESFKVKKVRMRRRRKSGRRGENVMKRKVAIIKCMIKFAWPQRQHKEENPTLLSLSLEAMVVVVRWLVVVECSFDNSQGYTYDQRATEEENDSHDDDAYFEASLLAPTLHGRGV